MYGPELGFGPGVLIASLSFDVRPDKRGEFVSAVNRIVQSVRWSQGCLGCRLVTDCENPNLFTLLSEWDSETFLERYFASTEFQILEGTRFLLRDGPGLSIDEVVSRGRPRGPLRHSR
jgi:quinol monooxygenase YgiN